MKKLLPDALEDQQLRKYLPDIETEADAKQLEREFFFAIFATLKTDALKLLISKALEARFGSLSSPGAKKTIVISQAWQEEL